MIDCSLYTNEYLALKYKELEDEILFNLQPLLDNENLQRLNIEYLYTALEKNSYLTNNFAEELFHYSTEASRDVLKIKRIDLRQLPKMVDNFSIMVDISIKLTNTIRVASNSTYSNLSRIQDGSLTEFCYIMDKLNNDLDIPCFYEVKTSMKSIDARMMFPFTKKFLNNKK